jgi:hypothetical protein
MDGVEMSNTLCSSSDPSSLFLETRVNKVFVCSVAAWLAGQETRTDVSRPSPACTTAGGTAGL